MSRPSRTILTRLTRRASLVSLGAAGITAAIPPLASQAGKKKGDANKRCKKQVAPCKSFFTLQCGDAANSPECAAVLACCESLKTCNFAGFVTCLSPLT